MSWRRKLLGTRQPWKITERRMIVRSPEDNTSLKTQKPVEFLACAALQQQAARA
jgi:hypothetical protein